jgi:hypothetical protein
MRAKVKSVSHEAVLTRVLEGLEPELIEATDEDITQAAQDLGMDLSMKGSAAFMGLKSPFKLDVAEIFDLSAFDAEQVASLRRRYEEWKEGRAKGAPLPRERKDSDKT